MGMDYHFCGKVLKASCPVFAFGMLVPLSHGQQDPAAWLNDPCIASLG